MWSVIPSMEWLLQDLSVIFTDPSFQTQCQVLLGWLMCLGRHTEFRVFETIVADQPICRTRRHPFDRFYNFFQRSAWDIVELSRELAIQVVVQLQVAGPLKLVVDDTLLHKSGKHVFGLGWFHDAVASTKKRAVTAPGNNWVVLGLAVSVPFTDGLFCLPIHAKLRQAGKDHPGPAELALEMLRDVVSWFPDRQFILIADGGYSAGKLLKQLPPQVTYVGLMRGDAALRSPALMPRPKSKSGPHPKQGPRIPSPRAMVTQADRKGSHLHSPWKQVTVKAYGETRRFQVLSFQAVWPKVFGPRPILVVISRALDEGYDDVYLYTTDLTAKPEWVITTYCQRTSIEGVFKDSKQVMQIQKPQHWSQSSIEKLAPWVWLMQTLVTLWYLGEGHTLPEVKKARKNLGEWDNEWSLRHMCRIFRRVTIRHTINAMSATKRDLLVLADKLENYLFLAG